MTQAFDDIRTVLQNYFDGLHHCDTNTLGNVFHPAAIYATADEIPFVFRTMDAYLAIVADRESPASRREARKDVIVSIDVAGANTALAKVQCTIGARDFVDFLSLVRISDRWWIISKVFQIIETTQQD